MTTPNRLASGFVPSTDVITALIQNSMLIAKAIRSDYLTETENLVRTIDLAYPPTTSLKQQVRNFEDSDQVSHILKSLSGNCVGSLDGGQGKGLLGTALPFVIRTIVFTVKLGDTSLERESFDPSYFMVSELSSGAMGTGEQLLGVIQEIFELKSALLALNKKQIDILMLHGPLTRPFNVFLGATYYLSESDIETIIGKDLFSKFKIWKSTLTTQQQKDLDRFSSFAVLVYLLAQLFETAAAKRTLLCGVVERTTSTEFIQQILFNELSSVYKNNSKWFDKVTGRSLPGYDQDEYVKQFLDTLGYTDPLVLGALLRKGEFTNWKETRSNRYQLDNRKIGLPTGFITGQQHLSSIVPQTQYSYVRTSDFNAPFRIETPAWLKDGEKEELVSAIFAFSQFLPQYAFPVNLDVVDKVAKIPNWMTNAFISMISNEIYEGVIKDGKKPSIDYKQLLQDRFRDWDLRPGVRKKIV